VKSPRAISKVISSQKLFLASAAALIITLIYLRLDASIVHYIGDPNVKVEATFIIRERSTLFDRFGWLFVGIIVAYISGNVAQKHKSFVQYPDDPQQGRNEED
jgi:hypothetical protein